MNLATKQKRFLLNGMTSSVGYNYKSNKIEFY
jgi:hypothetical protein